MTLLLLLRLHSIKWEYVERSGRGPI